MAAPRELAQPPIAEALMDVRVVVEHPINIERLSPLRDELIQAFPKVDERRQVAGEFRVESGKLLPPTMRDVGFHGLWMRTADETRLVQFRTDGFAFNNVGIGHYMGGEALLSEGLRLWSLYADVAGPAAVIRVALRYINRLELPLAVGDEFRKYLTTPPELPDEAPQKMSSFLSRTVAHDDTGATAVVTQKLDTVPGAGAVPVLVDLDVFFSKEIAPTSADLRPYLEMLRELKNRLFFSLITEDTVKLYL
jgi:uncharacterized protein (TIGR04255 family)